MTTDTDLTVSVDWTDAELNALAMYRHAETHEDAREAEEDLRALVAAREAQAAAKALREAADGLLEGLDDLPATGHGLSYRNCTTIDARALRGRADRIERGES